MYLRVQCLIGLALCALVKCNQGFLTSKGSCTNGDNNQCATATVEVYDADTYALHNEIVQYSDVSKTGNNDAGQAWSVLSAWIRYLTKMTVFLTDYRWPAAFGSAALNMGMPGGNDKVFSNAGGQMNVAFGVLTGQPAQIEQGIFTDDVVCV